MIKLLVLIAVVFAVIWFLRGARRQGQRGPRAAATGSPPAPPAPQDMVECPVCRVHLPRADALPGPDGQLYCCAEHTRQAKP
jgi:uncharacterized protein